MAGSAGTPGTIWQKTSPGFGIPPTWVQVGNFAMGVPGPAGPPGQTVVVQGSGGGGGGGSLTLNIGGLNPGTPVLTDYLPFHSVSGNTDQIQTIAKILLLGIRGYIDGLVLSNDSITPNTVVDIAAGVCSDSTNTGLLSLSALIGKDLSATWASGTGNGGLFNGSIASSTWYHVFIIQKSSDGSIDAGFDTSITASHIPAGYTLYRRIGSVLTDGSSHVLAFHQYNNEFWWDTSIKDIDATTSVTTAVTRTLSVPPGLKVACIIDANVDSSTSAGGYMYLSSLDSADLVPSYPNCIQSNSFFSTAVDGFFHGRIWTNTSSQIRSRINGADANTILKIRTRGWVDPRGRDS